MEEPLKTSDTSLAAFLDYHGHYLVGIMKDPNDTMRKVFVFVLKEESPQLLDEYKAGYSNVHLKGYYKSIRKMHQMLRNGSLIDENIAAPNS